MLHYLALPFYPPIARTLKRGTLLSSLILFENLFTPFCWITSFVLNEHTGYFFSCIIWNSSFALLRCYTCLLTKKLFDNIVSLKLLWWDLAHKKEVGQGQCWRKHRGRRVGAAANLDWQESERRQKYHKEIITKRGWVNITPHTCPEGKLIQTKKKY